MTSSPATSPSRAGAANALTSSHASGASSDPCLGAPFSVLIVDRIVPTGWRRATTARLTERFFMVTSWFRACGTQLRGRAALPAWLIAGFSNPREPQHCPLLDAAIRVWTVAPSTKLQMIDEVLDK